MKIEKIVKEMKTENDYYVLVVPKDTVIKQIPEPMLSNGTVLIITTHSTYFKTKFEKIEFEEHP